MSYTAPFDKTPSSDSCATGGSMSAISALETFGPRYDLISKPRWRNSRGGPDVNEDDDELPAAGSVRLGTAGWAVPRMFAHRFPAQGSALVRYARRFSACEINSTFWRRHKPDTFVRWRESVPPSFRFAVKAPRKITHEAELLGSRPLLLEFLGDVSGLGDRLGPVLFQLPPSLAFEARRVRGFLRVLRSVYHGMVAWEPRHPSWFTPSVDAVLAGHGIARVAADPPRVFGGDAPGGLTSLAYFRWHGSPVVYRTAYGPDRLATLAERMPPQGPGASVWCIFDNTASGAAAGDALCLDDILGRR
jgi:uncharacterized protein YecE (DUF72 family)